MKFAYLLGLLLSGVVVNNSEDNGTASEVTEAMKAEEALSKDEDIVNKRRALGEVSNNQEKDYDELENVTESAGDRIVGGSEARPHEFPFMAALRRHGRLFCGGSLLDRRHVLTAAHCVVRIRKSDLKHISVSLGDHNIKTSSEADNVVVGVKSIIRHRGFSGSHMDSDVAILTLRRPVDFSATIQPVGLAQGEEQFTGQTATASGWGSLRSGGSLPSKLQKVNLKVVFLSTCRNKLSSSSSPITENMLCAANRGKDTCQGDSGGPLFVSSAKNWIQIGITSWGFGCANPRYPGVYARVSTLEPWIRRIVDKY